MTPNNTKSLGSNLAKLFNLNPDEIDDSILESVGAIAVKLAKPIVLEQIREPTDSMGEAGALLFEYGAWSIWRAMVDEAIRAEKEAVRESL